jgi:hypothetical protein
MESRLSSSILMSVPATCPFCNALVPANAPIAGGRVMCPRCGEAVGTGPVEPTVNRAETPATGTVDSRTWLISRPALTVILVALIGVGLWAAWANRHHIRSQFAGPAASEKPAVVKPADLPGLGYLPESTEAVLAVQMPFLLERLGPEADGDPAKALAALGLPEAVSELLDQMTAIGLKNVDQMAVGLGFEGHALPPQLVIVVHARQPFNLEAIAQRTKAHAKKKDGRILYVGKAGALPEVNWWQASDRVLIATITARDFAGVPALPRSGIDHLRPGLASLVRERVADDACAWFVATSDKWDQYLQPYVLLPLTPLQGRKDLIKPAERLRSVVLSIPNEPDHPVDVQIAVKSTEAGASLRAALADRFHGEPVEVTGEDEWALVHIPNDLSRIETTVSRLIVGGN